MQKYHCPLDILFQDSEVKVKVAQSCSTLWPHGLHGILQARILESVDFPFSRDLPNPRIKPRSPAMRADSLPAELQWKPKNTGVGSSSLLQQVFPTQDNNFSIHWQSILLFLPHFLFFFFKIFIFFYLFFYMHWNFLLW